MTVHNHFDIWEWVDFVRGVTPGPQAASMRQHLASGCMRCNEPVRVLSGFARHGSRDAAVEPPAEVVRRAEAIFSWRQPQPSILAQLVFDSFLQPQPAGLRADEQLSRYVRFEADGVVVELQLEQRHGLGVESLVGHISDRAGLRTPTTRMPVLLMCSKGLVASAVCNGLGEFEMAYRAARDLRMYVPLGESGAHIELRMDEVVPPLSNPRFGRVSSVADSRAHGRKRKRGSRNNSGRY